MGPRGFVCGTWSTCWVGFWYLRDFGKRIKNPNITLTPKTQHEQTGQGCSPGGGTTPSLGLMCFSLGTAPHCNTKAPVSSTSGVRHPRPQRQVLAGCLSHRGGLREIRKPVLEAHTVRTGSPLTTVQLPHPEPPNLCQIITSLLPPMAGGQGHPKPGSLISRNSV